MTSKRKKYILFFLIAVIVLYVVIYIIPTVTGALTSSYTVEYGVLRIMDKVDGYVIRSEQVYFSDKGGTENRYFKEGALIRKGSTVMEITGKSPDQGQLTNYDEIRRNVKGRQRVRTSDYTAEKEGILSYYADGYETRFSPSTVEKRSYSDYRSLDGNAAVNLKRNTVAEGDPVFKVSDRSEWYIVAFVPKDHKNRYKTGNEVWVSTGGQELKAVVKSTHTEGSRVRLILRSDYYMKGFSRKRVISCRIITSRNSGLIIRNSSISKRNGHEGVWVRQKTGEYKFVRISVIATDGERSVIQKSYFYDSKGNLVNTVKGYDEVLRRGR